MYLYDKWKCLAWPFELVDIRQPVRSSVKSKKLSPLPSEYTTVKDQFRRKNKTEKLWAPMCNLVFEDISDFQILDSALEDEIVWLNHVYSTIQNQSNDVETIPNGWAAHHASMKRGHSYPPGINTISPVIRDKVATLITQGHCMLENI